MAVVARADLKITKFAAPAGPVPVDRLQPGDTVWTVSDGGLRPATVQACTAVDAEDFLELAVAGGHREVEVALLRPRGHAGGGAGAAAYHRGDPGHQRLFDLLRADEVDVGVDAAGGDDTALAGDDLGACADRDRDPRLDVGIAGLADAGDAAVHDRRGVEQFLAGGVGATLTNGGETLHVKIPLLGRHSRGVNSFAPVHEVENACDSASISARRGPG